MIRETIYEIIRFGLAGGTVAGLHLLFVYILTSVLGFWYIFSSIFSYICATILNFTLQKYYVRRDTNIDATKRQFSAYVFLSTVMLTLNTLLMYTLVSIFLLNYLFAQAGIILVLSTATFYINRYIIFQ